MKPAFAFKEIREAEKSIIEKEGIPSLILMENAGKNAFDVIVSLYPDIAERAVHIVCGKGNNAGDGFVIARQFIINNIPVHVFNAAMPGELNGDALVNYDILMKQGSPYLTVTLIDDKNDAAVYESLLSQKGKILVIDAQLGSGINGRVKGKFERIIDQVNAHSASNKKVSVVSVDVPSGLVASGEQGRLINAEYTITMGAVKTELLFGAGKENSGTLFVVPIGISEGLLDKYNYGGKQIAEENDIRALFPKRKKASYKYSNGRSLIIGGSKGLSGAVIMSSLAALNSGSGAVLAAYPQSISSHFSKKLFEVIKTELPETNDGSITSDAFSYLAAPLKRADAVLIGPGLSLNKHTGQFLCDFIAKCSKPMVIDADGLTLLSENIEILLKRNNNAEIILTPHLGEFQRLSGLSMEEILNDRFTAARDFAAKYNINLVLKSETSFSCLSSGEIYLNDTGNEALASAGSGDVLSGLIVSMLAQTGSAKSAMLCGNYIHGLLAEKYYQKYGNKQSASQQKLISFIPEVITELLN